VLDISFKDLNTKYNEDKFFPMDGELIKAFDQLSAFIEARLSIKHGISSDSLREAETNIYGAMKGLKVSGVDFGKIFHYFSHN
jgi:putative hydrolase of HD superfamily